jgi:hypothetical protein
VLLGSNRLRHSPPAAASAILLEIQKGPIHVFVNRLGATLNSRWGNFSSCSAEFPS